MLKKNIYIFFLLFICLTTSFAQKNASAKYPSLLWEITGNGMSSPSYLFGTMHVSSKLVFHLSDSFYLALKSVDAVALELNPDTWQEEMVKMNRLKQNYARFSKAPRGDYLTENSFRLSNYEDEFKSALSSEPTIVNSLLYRSFKQKEDFEEDTFLDLYIYQTGKKLGKRATGVENYFEAEKIVLEAYAEMAREKNKKSFDGDGESRYEILDKTQDAYRRGDLDLMDSLDRMMDRSEAFTEKFLYKRNEIQAHSIDTILKKSSLFVGIGAAHLPGPRGVIELLRSKGYKLRPIFMADRDALQKEEIDKLKVPVRFTTLTSEDKVYSVAVPGPLYNMEDESAIFNRRQYADMSNGAYYLVTRIKTYENFRGQHIKDVLKRADSALYENIPGKILEKRSISRNGYQGFDITNRTRRGDLQRYQIYITPFEILIFKMSGKADYVDGDEAKQFFSSIRIAGYINKPVQFEPPQGGFSAEFPHQPHVYRKSINGIDERWEYEAEDPLSGDVFLVMKKAVYNFRFLDEDSFDLGLIEASFRNPDFFSKQISRREGIFMGYPCVDVKEKMKDGAVLQARFVLKGPHYYVIAAKTRNKRTDLSSFFNAFKFTDYKYAEPEMYTDTFMHFSVRTPVFFEMDEDIREIAEKATNAAANGNNFSGYISYWPKTKNGLFKSDATGEMVGVSVQEYPRYYYVHDTSKLWMDNISDFYDQSDLLLYRSDSIQLEKGMAACRIQLRDTGSSRTITRMIIMKDNYSFSLVTMGDTLSEPSSFINSFFNSFKPAAELKGRSIYENRVDEFFADLFSKDSALQQKAQQAISNIYYGESGIPKIENAINRLNLTDKDYFDTKSRLIAELGYIKDTSRPRVVNLLKKIFEQTADTSIFQNQVFKALARHKTREAYLLFKELMLLDPPIFADRYEYSGLFRNLDDSLLLAASLFPDLLQLATLADYKDKVISLLVTLVDSNLIKASDYEEYFTTIYFDAKVELKKQQLKDEKIMEKELLNAADEEKNKTFVSSLVRNNKSSLEDYSVLLSPFYSNKKPVELFFDRLLRSREPGVRLSAAVLLLRNNHPVADSILWSLAADDRYRSELFVKLEKINRLDAFPSAYKDQRAIARSFLASDKNNSVIDSIVFLKKIPATYLNKPGVVYCFKYRIRKEDDWKIGLSGLQPANEKEIGTDDRFTKMTGRKIKADESLDDQLEAQLKRIIVGLHKSGKNFYKSSEAINFRTVSSYRD